MLKDLQELAAWNEQQDVVFIKLYCHPDLRPHPDYAKSKDSGALLAENCLTPPMTVSAPNSSVSLHVVIPQEVMGYIFSFLDARGLGSSMSVCKAWKKILELHEEALWGRRYTTELFGFTVHMPQQENYPWKNRYRASNPSYFYTYTSAARQLVPRLGVRIMRSLCTRPLCQLSATIQSYKLNAWKKICLLPLLNLS